MWSLSSSTPLLTRYCRLSWQSTQTLQRCRTSSEPLASKRPCKAIETSRKPFSTSQCLHKKGAKAAREEKREVKQAAGAEAAGTTDPYDFADLEAHIAPALERLKSELSKLRGGGRFNPEVVENLRVQPEKGSNQSVRLSDLAQVVPKGRQVQIIVGEKDVCLQSHTTREGTD